jgi:hypothetical protein
MTIKEVVQIYTIRKLKGDFEFQMNNVHKLAPIATAEIENASEEDKNAQSCELLKGHLPLITCDCGAQILLVPDLREMNLAIKAHVAEHKKKGNKVQGNVNTPRNISRLLNQLTIMKINEINGI